MAGIKAAGQQGRQISEVAGPTVKLPASDRRAGAKIEHCLWPWPRSFKVKVWNSLIWGMGGWLTWDQRDVSRSFMTMTVTYGYPWWGGWMYHIVIGLTSDVGVPSTYLVWLYFSSIENYLQCSSTGVSCEDDINVWNHDKIPVLINAKLKWDQSTDITLLYAFSPSKTKLKKYKSTPTSHTDQSPFKCSWYWLHIYKKFR